MHFSSDWDFDTKSITIYTADAIQNAEGVGFTHEDVLLLALLLGGDFDNQV